jgi:hypothetical protein
MSVDTDRRLVRVIATGVIDLDALYEARDALWAIPEASQHDLLFDFTAVTMLQVSGQRSTTVLETLAARAGQLDQASPQQRLLIVAPQPWLYGLCRMYAVYRARSHPRRVVVGATLAEALALLDRPAAESDVASGVQSVAASFTRLSEIVLGDDGVLSLISGFAASDQVRVRGTVPSVPAPWAGTRRRRRASRCR